MEYKSAILQEIKGITKQNSRDINGNSLRLMQIGDDVTEVKQEIKSMSECINEMHDNVNEMINLNKEMKKENKEIGILLGEIMQLQKEIRRDLDKVLCKDTQDDYLEVGVM